MVLSGTLACFLLIYFMNYLVLRPVGQSDRDGPARDRAAI